MFEALKDIACFVTAFVSFLYGTRVAWVSGKKCQFSERPEDKTQSLRNSIPVATIIYFFGFLIVFSSVFSGFLTWIVFSLTSAIILASLVVSTAMPELKRSHIIKGSVLVKLTDGTSCRVPKDILNAFLENGKVTKFKRTDGWVVVGKDQLRDMSVKSNYYGSERREAL
jgi:hypothetical protein